MVWLGTLGLLLAFASMAWAAPIYTTDFSANENPISESGAWSHISPLWANVQTAGGLAFGTQVGNLANPAAFNDSNATLSGFSPDVTITATVHLASNIADGQTHEVELLFRMGGSATQTRGYEMSFDTGGNVTLVRWNGDLGDYTFVNHTGGANNEVGGLKDGDVISAKASGNTFTASVNGVPIYTATDDTWKDGQPGIGFFVRRDDGLAADADFNAKYALSSLSVVDDGTVQGPTGPTDPTDPTGPTNPTDPSNPDPPLAATPEPVTLGLVGFSLTLAGWYASKRRPA
jgi:hypothetical protein